MIKRFQRKIEDFTCGECGEEIKGDGYTNHCPHCLWSKHVDINPGDRASDCGGLMEPVSKEIEKDEYVITHRCVECKYEKRNKSAPKDDFDKLLNIF
jgi:hypothetical protein